VLEAQGVGDLVAGAALDALAHDEADLVGRELVALSPPGCGVELLQPFGRQEPCHVAR
jgi:hypothetical protein